MTTIIYIIIAAVIGLAAGYIVRKQVGESKIKSAEEEAARIMEEATRNTDAIRKEAMLEAGVTPKVVPIRGGTDGARLSYEGLPCPNLFTGGENFHGRFEYIPVEDMQASVRVLKNILRNAVK